MCKAPTYGPCTDQFKYANIGQAAHITAAAPGGPRYDPNMTPEEWSSAANGIRLCSNCHTIIDRDVNEYLTAKLKKIKRDAEEEARREMGIPKDPELVRSTLASCVSVTTIVKIRKHKSHLAQLNNHAITAEEGQTYLDQVGFINFDRDHYLPDVGKELLAYLQQLVICCHSTSVQMEVIRRLSSMCHAFKNQFSEKDVEQTTSVAKTIKRNSQNRNSPPYQSAVAFLKDLVMEFPQGGLQTAPANELQRLIDQEKADTEVEPKTKRPRISTDTGTECTDEDKLKKVLHMKGEMSYLELIVIIILRLYISRPV